MTLRLKQCARCHTGDCVLEKEDEEEYYLCLQCGFREPVKEEQNGTDCDE